MASPVEIEIEIVLHAQQKRYNVDLRFDRSDSEATPSPIGGETKLDLEKLRALSEDRFGYGKTLYEDVFADPNIRNRFENHCKAADSEDMPVRARLLIDDSAPELHTLCWESLRDPKSGDLLVTRERFRFSRFLSTDDWRPVRPPRARDELRALVVIANPSNITDYQPGGRPLAPLDVAGEKKRATESLGKIPSFVLSDPGSASFNGIIGKLREGYDILYLVCHGALIDGEPRLCLEDQTGVAAIVPGSELVTRLSELKQRPRLVVFASCQSAGGDVDGESTDGGVLAAIGPRMAQAGIPAVIAMQGNVSMRTVGTFMPIFFRELQKDGAVDRAVAAARGAVRDWDDWWMPVLFTCLKHGRLSWYTPGFTGGGSDFERWHALVNNIQKKRCTPIIGSGMLESFIGPFRDIARKWAIDFNYPMAGNEREQLPMVAQYLAVAQDPPFARDKFCEALRTGVMHHYGSDLPDKTNGASLQELISQAGKIRRTAEAAEPHKVLAGLGLSIFLTTNPDNLLADALIEAGKKPHVMLCPRSDQPEEPAKESPDYRPSVEEPLVYHLFGHLRDPESVVLTQDDYFDYLIDITRNNEVIPPSVRAHLVDTALLFLGFQMSDWDFRVFFRSIMSQEGRRRRNRLSHVAVQIDPEQERLIDPKRARDFLERYFSGTEIDIFWGSAEDFLRELLVQMQK